MKKRRKEPQKKHFSPGKNHKKNTFPGAKEPQKKHLFAGENAQEEYHIQQAHRKEPQKVLPSAGDLPEQNKP